VLQRDRCLLCVGSHLHMAQAAHFSSEAGSVLLVLEVVWYELTSNFAEYELHANDIISNKQTKTSYKGTNMRYNKHCEKGDTKKRIPTPTLLQTTPFVSKTLPASELKCAAEPYAKAIPHNRQRSR